MFEQNSEKKQQSDYASLAHLLHRSAHMMIRSCGHHGPHHGQGRVLRLIDESGKMSQRELMDTLQVRSSSLSELLAKLEARGCITRSRDEDDRRGLVIELTEEGKETIRTHEYHRTERVAALFASLSGHECEQLKQILGKLLAQWEREIPSGGRGHHHFAHHHGGAFAGRDHHHCAHHGQADEKQVGCCNGPGREGHGMHGEE